jgi:YHS domain-containing protein
MSIRTKLFALTAAVAAAFLFQAPAFTQHEGHQGATCPHMTATSASVDKAIALLEKGDGANIQTALAELRKVRKQVGECQEMCKEQMCGGAEGHGAHAGHDKSTAAAAKKVVDPVCGMSIDPAKAAAKSVYAGKTYYFCTEEDKKLFDKDPEKYLKKKV